MFSTEEIALLTICANNLNFTDLHRKMVFEIIDRINTIEDAETPTILIVIEDGAFSLAYGNQDINLIVEDVDNIERGGDLYYPCLTSYNKEILKKRIEEVKTAIAVKSFSEIKITVPDPHAEYPFCVVVAQDTVARFKTPQEAIDHIIKEGIV